MPIGTIYKITNTINGMIYIGQSRNFKNRRGQHISSLKGGYHRNYELQEDWFKFGQDSFTWEVLKTCPIQDMNSWEFHFISELNCVHPHGYNLTSGGTSFKTKPSEVTLNRQSESHKGIQEGSSNPASKLVEDDIPKIWDLLSKGIPSTDIAKQFGVSSSVIKNIKLGKRWVHVKPTNVELPTPMKEDPRILLDIWTRHLSGEPCHSIARDYGVTHTTVNFWITSTNRPDELKDVPNLARKRSHKLSKGDVEEILQLRSEGKSITEIGQIVGISHQSVSRVVSGKVCGRVTDLSEEDRLEIFHLREAGVPIKEVANRFGKSLATISRTHKSYKVKAA